MAEVDFKLAHCLNSVLGWLELGNLKEARAELESLPDKYDNDTDVLAIHWMLNARESDWDAALKVAERLVELDPENPSGWLHRAFAMRRASGGGLTQAAALLLPAFEKFPTETTIPFNLACYACQLGNLGEARAWLEKACARGEKEILKGMALADTDLEALWGEVRTW